MLPASPTAHRLRAHWPGHAASSVGLLLAGIGAVLVVAVPTAWGHQPEVDEPGRDEVAIECGGYDADGDVIAPAALEVERAPVDDDGRPAVPAVCGGYTEDGRYIGDD